MNNKVRLGDVSVLITKGTTPTSIGCDFADSGVNFVKSESISGHKYLDKSIYSFIDLETDKKLKRSRLADGDLLFSIAGAYLGKVGVVRKEDLPANTNQAVGIVRLDKKVVNVDYAYYYFSQNHINKHINKLSSQSSQPNLNLDLLSKLEIDLKNLSDQQRISAVLSALDAKIDLNNRINAELEAMAKTLYDYWFVQFDFPDKNGKPYKSSGGKMVWNKELKREIPAGWELKKLGTVLEISLGGTPSTHNKSFWENGTHNWLNSGEVADFPVVTSEMKITSEAIKKSATELLPKGTCLLSITRHLRPTILAIDACANQSVVGIKESGNIKSCFIYPYLKNEIPRLMQLRTGAQQPHINKEIVDDSLIVIPDSKVLSGYNQQAKPLYDQIINNAFQNQHLSCLRDWLLPMLMNGQVTVDSGSRDNNCSVHATESIYSESLPLAAETVELYQAKQEAVKATIKEPSAVQYLSTIINIPQRLLAHMHPNRAYSRADLTQAAGISAADWTWAIKQLIKEGKVRQTGEKRGARYSLKK